MPIPHQLLRAAIETLPDDTLLAMARHNGVSADLPRTQIVEHLSRDGVHLCSYSSHISDSDLRRIAKEFSINIDNPERGGLSYAVWKFVFDYDRNQQRREIHLIRGIPQLNADALRAELQSMARPCTYLTRNAADGPFAGVWGGPGIIPAPAVDLQTRPANAEGEKYRHWITLNCSRLPAEFAPLNLRGAASIYSDEWCGYTTNRIEDEEGYVSFDPKCVVSESSDLSIRVGDKVLFRVGDDGMPLFARPGVSYPSHFQVIEYATPPISDWLKKMGHTFRENDYSSIAAKELKDVYQEIIYDLNPILKGDCDIVAVVGGWTIDVEFTYAPLLGDRYYQLVFTLEGSEPWIQAFIRKETGKHYVRQLIT